jgi:EmrB/QacA subfamily drug resistance transporter
VTVALGTPVARRALAATVLGSGMAFLDGSIVNVTIPAIRHDLGAGTAGLQWVVDGYLVTLTALLLLGGALGDRYGRKRVFLLGTYVFTAASVACGLAPSIELLVLARIVQGVGGALLVPGSLALLGATIRVDDRARAVGAWSGLSGVATAIGPLLGGWLVDAVSWRLAFLVNVPLAVALVVVARGIPESVEEEATHLDLPGAVTAVAGLVLLTAGLIEEHVVLAVAGAVVLVAFVVLELRGRHPMLPMGLFRSLQFSGANVVTLGVYAGLGVAFFLVVVNLQISLGYSALEAGSAMLPVTVLMLLLSSRSGALAQRIGPRIPMTVGPVLMAAGFVALAGVERGDHYAAAVLPGVVVLGLGLATTVAPLTAAVLAAVDEHHLGVGSAVNNAVARLAGLLAVAVLPSVAGVDLDVRGRVPGYATAMAVGAGCCVAGGVLAAATIHRVRPA